MKLYKVNLEGELINSETMIQALELNLNQRQTIAFVGAGGKTTSIYHLAKELISCGKKVIITTTTHMMLPKHYGVLEDDKTKILSMLATQHIAVVGIPCGNGKMTGVTDPFYQWLNTKADYVLVEADGSKRLPIKAPNSTEPVLPPDTDMVVIVAGISCLFKPLKDIAHRSELAAEILNCNLSHKLEPKDVAKLIKIGYCDKTDQPHKILLNQCDNEEQRKNAMEVVKYLAGCECILSYNINYPL